MRYYNKEDFVNTVELALEDYNELTKIIDDLNNENRQLRDELEKLKERYCRCHVCNMREFMYIIKTYPTYTQFSKAYLKNLDKIEDVTLHDFKVKMSDFDEDYLLRYFKRFYASVRKGYEVDYSELK